MTLHSMVCSVSNFLVFYNAHTGALKISQQSQFNFPIPEVTKQFFCLMPKTQFNTENDCN